MPPSVNNHFHRARTIVRSLVHGLDPDTGDQGNYNIEINSIRSVQYGKLSRFGRAAGHGRWWRVSGEIRSGRIGWIAT